jgi:hypothetical protein
MKNRIFSIAAILILSQSLLFYKTMELGNGDFTGYGIETAILIILAGLFFAAFNWARWILIVFLVLLFVVSVVGAIQHNDYVFYIIAGLQAIAIWLILVTKLPVKNIK